MARIGGSTGWHRLVGVVAIATLVAGGISLAVNGTGSNGHHHDHGVAAPRSASPIPASPTSTSPTSSSPTSPSSPGAGGGEPLAPHLLAASDLPPGWKVVPTSGDDSSGGSGGGGDHFTSCLEAAYAGVNTQNGAQIDFVYGAQKVPSLQELLGAAPAATTPVFAKATKAFADCGEITFPVSAGVVAKGTLAPAPFPVSGTATAAFYTAMTFPVEGTTATLGFEVVVVQKGRDLVTLVEESLGPPNKVNLEDFVRVAVAKL